MFSLYVCTLVIFINKFDSCRCERNMFSGFFLWINISSHRNIYIFMHIVKYIPNTYHFFNVYYVCKSKLKIRLGDKKWTNWLPGPFLRISRIDRGLNPQLTSSAPTLLNDETKIYSLGKKVKTVFYFQKMRRQNNCGGEIFFFFLNERKGETFETTDMYSRTIFQCNSFHYTCILNVWSG